MGHMDPDLLKIMEEIKHLLRHEDRSGRPRTVSVCLCLAEGLLHARTSRSRCKAYLGPKTTNYRARCRHKNAAKP